MIIILEIISVNPVELYKATILNLLEWLGYLKLDHISRSFGFARRSSFVFLCVFCWEMCLKYKTTHFNNQRLVRKGQGLAHSTGPLAASWLQQQSTGACTETPHPSIHPLQLKCITVLRTKITVQAIYLYFSIVFFLSIFFPFFAMKQWIRDRWL